MGMRPIDIIPIVGKTLDASQAQQNNTRGPSTTQEIFAVEESVQADISSEKVAAAEPEDQLELNANADGGGLGGGDSETKESEKNNSDSEQENEIPPNHIDFLA